MVSIPNLLRLSLKCPRGLLVLVPFLVYINDLEKGFKYNVKFFAYDTIFYSAVLDYTSSAAEHNHDLKKINQWAK